MSNLIIWLHQATLDFNFRIGKDISRIASRILEENMLQNQDAIQLLEEIKSKGLERDTKLVVTGFSEMLEGMEAIKKLITNEGYVPEVQIGGDPAIAAIRGHMLKIGPSQTDLPLVWYAGLLPNSVETALQNRQVNEAEEILEVFQSPRVQKVQELPQSIGLESDTHKLILIYGPGRSLNLLAPDGTFKNFLDSLLMAIKALHVSVGHIVIAVNIVHPEMSAPVSEETLETLLPHAQEIIQRYAGLTKASKQQQEEFMNQLVDRDQKRVHEAVYLECLFREIKASPLGKQVRIFGATRYLRKPSGAVDTLHAHAVLALLKEVDIISANNTEIDDLHTAYKGRFEEIPLAYKLRELPFKAIKICHAADGVIMDLGCRPEHIITSERLQKNPAGFIEEALRLSVDGATYAMDAIELGRTANETMIRIYSQYVQDETRRSDEFRATFLNFQPMPAGMISVASPRVVRTLGAIVGLGAIFDGLILSFLMRD